MAVLGADDTPAWAKGEGPPPVKPMDQETMEEMIMKLLFMPQFQTHMLVKEHEWDLLNLTLLQEPTFLSMKDLRIACENRGLSPAGNRIKLCSDLTGSFMTQRGEEERQRQLELDRRRARMRALGGAFMFGKGTRGALATGERSHSAKPLYITSLANDRVMRVFTGSDSGTVFALTRTEEVFVWGAVTGPLGLPQGQKPVQVYVKGEDKYTFEPADSDEESDAEDPVRRVVEALMGLHLGTGFRKRRFRMRRASLLAFACLDLSALSVGLSLCLSANLPRSLSLSASTLSFPRRALNRQDDLLAPVKLERLSKEHVVDLSVGRRSCVALTFHGDLFGWGYHQHNQLGFLLETVGAGLTDKAQEQALEAHANRQTMIKFVPTMVRADTECPLANVSVGTDSTLAADREGRLMVWGDANRRVRADQVRDALSFLLTLSCVLFVLYLLCAQPGLSLV